MADEYFFVGECNKNALEYKLNELMVFTIEPMINMGAQEIYIDEEDGWTVYTEDGSPSAQWEIQLVVTEEGYEILCW